MFGIHRHLKPQMLSEYLDGRLNPGSKAKADRELASCAVCREELDSLQATVSLLELLPEVPLPRSFTLAAAPAMENHGRPADRPGPWFLSPPSWAYAGAASLAGLALAVLISADATGLLMSGATLEATTAAEAPTAVFESRAAAPPSSLQDASATPVPAQAMAAAPPAEESRSRPVDAEAFAESQDSALAGKSLAPPSLELAQAAEPAQAESAGDAPAAERFQPAEPTNQGIAGAETDRAAPALPATPAPAAEAQLTTEAPVVQPAPVSQLPMTQAGKTALVWRILEGVAAGLGLLFLAGLTLKWRRSRRSAYS